jgi:C1A family cysteine protease
VKKPVSAGIHVDKNLQLYKKGLYKGEEKDPNHAVMIVGFNKDFGFWSKNSWGGKWGEEGYFWVDTQ